MAEFTKGPWVVCGDGYRIKPIQRDQYFRPLADIGPVIEWNEEDGNWRDSDDKQAKANAHLIAAAPDMYEALIKLSCLGNGDELGNSIGNRIAQDAIAKAEGKS